ncbi:MAG: hypothetical protein WCD86_10170 [Ktedonobacteraceae bacterium]
MKNASQPDARIAASRDTQPHQKSFSRNLYIKLDHRVKEAPALSRTTIAVYEALLWHRREKDSCWPGYEKIGKRAKVKSKTTISLHLKVLRKVGLTTTKRRGYKRTNINYPLRASELTESVSKKLHRKHEHVIEEIIKETKETTKLRQVERELRSKKSIQPRSQKIAVNRSYPQNDEVQLLDSKKEAKASSRYSSNLNHNDSKIKNSDERRGGGFKPIAVYVQAAKEMPLSQTRSRQIAAITPGAEELPIQKSSPQQAALQPLTSYAKIREIVLGISSDIQDQNHCRENVSHALNLFKTIRQKRGGDAEGFIQSLWNARGLTLEIIYLLDRPGAYFFTVLRRQWNVELSSCSRSP